MNHKKNPRVLSIGTMGNSEIDIVASKSNQWCDGIYFRPCAGSNEMDVIKEIDRLNIELKEYDALLVWHQALPEPLLTILKRAVVENPSVLIIGNSHGYNKSILELYKFYRLNVPQLYMDYYSMWGPYFTDRYKEVFGIEAKKKSVLSLGSLRHDFLFKNYKWDANRTNGKVLLIHEPVSSEGWNDPSPEPIGDNCVTDSIIEELAKNKIPFDFKVHPNWPDFVSNSGDNMWSPPSGVNVVNIPITDMINYEAVIASWSTIQFEALAMGIPVINIKYEYPTVNSSEWGPGKYGLLRAVKPNQITTSLNNIKNNYNKADIKLLNYFLGDLGNIGEQYYRFIKEKMNVKNKLNRKFYRLIHKQISKVKHFSRSIKSRLE